MLIGAGFLEGNWEAFKKQSAKVHLIEPVLEGVLQLFFQFIILYIIYGPGTSSANSNIETSLEDKSIYLLRSTIGSVIFAIFFKWLISLFLFYSPDFNTIQCRSELCKNYHKRGKSCY